MARAGQSNRAGRFARDGAPLLVNRDDKQVTFRLTAWTSRPAMCPMSTVARMIGFSDLVPRRRSSSRTSDHTSSHTAAPPVVRTLVQRQLSVGLVHSFVGSGAITVSHSPSFRVPGRGSCT